jgi:argininosuccinate lyase
MPAFDDLLACINISRYALEQIEVNPAILKDERYQYLFSVEAVNQLVLEGASFRDAYRIIGEQIQQGQYAGSAAEVSYTHEGSIGNLCNEEIRGEMNRVLRSFAFEKVNSALASLCESKQITA